MLSKSAAKAFFLGGTALCSSVFLGMTYDTFQQIPRQTNAAGITDSVKRGKELWEANNCMGCHTLFGEGAYYAPELTRVYERRGPTFIAAMIKDPQAMFPGQRQMTNYHFKDEQIADLVSFLQWAGTVDLNGFPAKPSLGPAAPRAETMAATQPTIYSQLCTSCHSLGGSGGTVGPALDGVGSRRDRDYLVRWLENPKGINPATTMPKLPLSEAQIGELASFLSANKESAQ